MEADKKNEIINDDAINLTPLKKQLVKPNCEKSIVSDFYQFFIGR